MDTRDKGLYEKFEVIRTDGTGGSGDKHEHCRYLALDVDHDPMAGPTVLRYASLAREKGYAAFADDLETLVGDKGRKQFNICGICGEPAGQGKACKGEQTMRDKVKVKSADVCQVDRC